MRPMPSPKGTNAAALFVPDTFPMMALDEAPKYPRAALPGARGGRTRDQDPGDPDTVVASSPGEAAYRKMFAILGDKLNQEDLDAVQQLLGELLGATDPNSDGNPALAGDRRPSYEVRFPNQGRLVRTF
jgi:hypothetical protein